MRKGPLFVWNALAALSRYLALLLGVHRREPAFALWFLPLFGHVIAPESFPLELNGD